MDHDLFTPVVSLQETPGVVSGDDLREGRGFACLDQAALSIHPEKSVLILWPCQGHRHCRRIDRLDASLEWEPIPGWTVRQVGTRGADGFVGACDPQTGRWGWLGNWGIGGWRLSRGGSQRKAEEDNLEGLGKGLHGFRKESVPPSRWRRGTSKDELRPALTAMSKKTGCRLFGGDGSGGDGLELASAAIPSGAQFDSVGAAGYECCGCDQGLVSLEGFAIGESPLGLGFGFRGQMPGWLGDGGGWYVADGRDQKGLKGVLTIQHEQGRENRSIRCPATTRTGGDFDLNLRGDEPVGETIDVTATQQDEGREQGPEFAIHLVLTVDGGVVLAIRADLEMHLKSSEPRLGCG